MGVRACVCLHVCWVGGRGGTISSVLFTEADEGRGAAGSHFHGAGRWLPAVLQL